MEKNIYIVTVAQVEDLQNTNKMLSIVHNRIKVLDEDALLERLNCFSNICIVQTNLKREQIAIIKDVDGVSNVPYNLRISFKQKPQ